MIYLFTLLALIINPSLAKESEALRMMRYACENNGSSKACFNYANLLLRRNQKEKAQRFFKRGCELGSKRSCARTPVDSLEVLTKKVIEDEGFTSLGRQQQKRDRELIEILEKYCDKEIQDACNALECVLKDNFAVCEQQKRIASRNLDLGLEQYKKFVEGLQGVEKKRFNTEEALVKNEKKKCKDKGEKVCFKALILQGKQMRWVGKLMMQKENAALKAKCDKGSVKSCYVVDFISWQKKKLKELESLGSDPSNEP